MTRSSCLVDLLVSGIYRLRVSQEDVDGVHIASRKSIQRPAQHRLHARAEAVNIGYWFAQVVFDGEAVGPGYLPAVFPHSLQLPGDLNHGHGMAELGALGALVGNEFRQPISTASRF